MEMNTRLQVEHPVTESITFLDLVEWQLLVAAGHPLPLAQEDLEPEGHAIEARLYAEDPSRNFLPQTGRLAHLRLPSGVRVDSGVREGDEVSPHYDPMIAKLIARGDTREEALSRLRSALARTEIAGLTTNLPFLRRLLAHEGFSNGDMDTGLIDRDLAALTAPPETPPAAPALAALAALHLDTPAPDRAPFSARDGFRLWSPERRRLTLDGPEGPTEIALSILAPGHFEIHNGPETTPLTLSGPPEALRYRYGADAPARPATLVRHAGRITIIAEGATTTFSPPDPIAAAEAASAGDTITSPMPGLIKLVTAAPGDRVTEGQTLIVMEAMKMEHRLTAPRDGEVSDLLCTEGAQVAEGAILLKLAVEETPA